MPSRTNGGDKHPCDMFEDLDVSEGQRILEIGTGTGYNAVLLAHRLDDDNVFSVDIDPELSTPPAEGWPASAVIPISLSVTAQTAQHHPLGVFAGLNRPSSSPRIWCHTMQGKRWRRPVQRRQVQHRPVAVGWW